MRHVLVFSLLVTLSAPTFAAVPPADPGGRWDGAIELPTGQLAVTITLTPEGDGGWAGTIDIPAQGVHGFALSAVGVDGGMLHCEMAGIPGTPTFDGALADAGGKITGTFRQGGQSLPFSLTRAPEGSATDAGSAMPAEPVPGEGAAGEWMGALHVGPLTLRLALHVATAEDGGLQATLDSLDQGTSLSVDTLTFAERKLHLTIKQIGGAFEGTMNGDGSAVEGSWSQGGRTLPLTFYRTAKPFTLKRPQTPQPPFPYDSREVSFRNEGAGIRLAGTLLVPHGDGPFPAVVFVTGSGPQDRDESLMGHKPFLVIADALARRGIASLRYDDRGAGKSEGDHMGSTVDDFAADAAAAVAFLAAQPKIDQHAIGILGHSEGGLTGPKVAVTTPAVDFLVLLAPPGEPLRDLLMRQQRAILEQRGVDESLLDQATVVQKKELGLVADSSLPTPELQEKLRADAEARQAELTDGQKKALGLDEGSIEQGIQLASSPWFRSLMREVPAVPLRKVKVPVLALFGGKDLQVDAEVNSAAVKKALAEAGDEDVTVRTLPGLNHLFQHATTGAVEEYGAIEETISPEVLQIVGDWIEARFGGA